MSVTLAVQRVWCKQLLILSSGVSWRRRSCMRWPSSGSRMCGAGRGRSVGLLGADHDGLPGCRGLAAAYDLPAGVCRDGGLLVQRPHAGILLGRYSDCYASNQFRALQQFFKWHATEDPDEPRPNPMARGFAEAELRKTGI